MTPVNGQRPPDSADKTLGDIVVEVSEKASLLVREEIELAKAEVAAKAGSLAKGGGIAAAAGVFLLFALVVFLQALAFFFNDLFGWEVSVWPGFLVVTGILVLLAAIAGFVAYKLFQKGSPPTPDMAIEEAKKIREQFEHQNVERDQVARTLEKGEELGA